MSKEEEYLNDLAEARRVLTTTSIVFDTTELQQEYWEAVRVALRLINREIRGLTLLKELEEVD